MSDLLELQKLRIIVFNEIIRLRNPNTTRFPGDASFINGQIQAFSKILGEIDDLLLKKSQ